MLHTFANPVLRVVALLSTIATTCGADTNNSVRLTVRLDEPGKPVARTMHGLFFEDINYAADGGLYAELVQNRSFEHANPMYSWFESTKDGAKGRLTVESEMPLNANNPAFLRLHAARAGFGAANAGFDGIVIRDGDGYRFSVYARIRAGDSNGLQVWLEDSAGEILTKQTIKELTTAWKKYEVKFTGNRDVTSARIAVATTRPGTVDIDMVSLFPQKTFKNRENGLRPDLAQAFADLKPGFLRFPGGCIVEGRDCENAYRWKDTIGDVAERKQNYNLWQNGQSPQYHQTFGLGFFEYFQFCEDIGAEPVPVVNCGMSCQARRGPVVPMDELGPWIQDALDLIEFANGPASSPWGARRAAMGHAKPFHMKHLAVGNEQWQQVYFDRYQLFHKAIRDKYPEIQIISSSGPAASDQHWHFAWEKFRTGTPADVVDEHYYVPPTWLFNNVDRYANFDRNGPKIFVGEFAAHDGRAKRNNLRAGLAEAAYMTGLLKNSDVVIMASYAPLLGKIGRSQWHPNLIWFDNSRLALTPSYHVQAQFGRNLPDVVLPVTLEAPTLESAPAGMIGVGTWNTQAEYKDIKVTAADGRILFEGDFSRGLDGWQTSGGDWVAADGVLRQRAGGEDIRAVVGDPSWKDYTLTLKARKVGGDEGFLILFQTPGIENPTWWNLGGWRNTEHGLQGDSVTEQRVQGRIDNNRWYDIRIEAIARRIKAYLDGKLLHDVNTKSTASFYAVAGRDNRAREVVMQLVNPFATAMPVSIELAGAGKLGSKATVTTLAHSSLEAENTLERPENVAPKTSGLSGISAQFSFTIEPFSLTTLRIPER
ncbi:MAG TPA: alpha-L-arabinofuranosidase C-terminal domain-containing protein [Verrucomicrobiae bacterium]|nr:alpha-L-arabinofuranosidase C-terminal domain-containing protein [Verrucomicrobiae bacterium]